ncbi:MAG: hypothetical protein O3A46_14370 [Candidatus Poribacteria bacterium]|nr:hypothetical protein [Candidatus Poribacteria bacterium]
MRRDTGRPCVFRFSIVVLFLLGPVIAGLTATSNVKTGNKSYKVKYDVILEWLTPKQDPSTPTGHDDWANANLSASETDSVAVYRLVMNQNLKIYAPTQTILTHTTTGETLATYYRIDSDGNGTSSNGFDTTGVHGVATTCTSGEARRRGRFRRGRARRRFFKTRAGGASASRETMGTC